MKDEAADFLFLNTPTSPSSTETGLHQTEPDLWLDLKKAQWLLASVEETYEA